jgi:hypothetical protein
MSPGEREMNRARFPQFWPIEKNRTFHCKCGDFTLPESAVDIERYRKEKDYAPIEPVCPKCKSQNYELGSFLCRYSLLAPHAARRPKRNAGPKLDFGDGGIEVRCRDTSEKESLYPIYNAYPRKRAPDKALSAIAKALKDARLKKLAAKFELPPADFLRVQVQSFATHVEAHKSKYYRANGDVTVPYMASWLNAGEWAIDWEDGEKLLGA